MKRRNFLALLGLGGLASMVPAVANARPELELSPSPDIEPLELARASGVSA